MYEEDSPLLPEQLLAGHLKTPSISSLGTDSAAPDNVSVHRQNDLQTIGNQSIEATRDEQTNG